MDGLGTAVVRCSENTGVAAYLLTKRQEMADGAKGIPENLDLTISKAYRSICGAKDPIHSLKDLSKIKGVGKWILRLMKGFFSENILSLSPSKQVEATTKGKQKKGPKRYLPQKNSVAYALLITLYRQKESGGEFMKKQELIDAAEASGLSRAAIGPDKAKGKPGQSGSSSRDWYTGWSSMKTLITRGLVAKSSCPAKYMLTQEGQEAARECMARSGLVVSFEPLVSEVGTHNLNGVPHLDDVNYVRSNQLNNCNTTEPCDSDSHDACDSYGKATAVTEVGRTKSKNFSHSVDHSDSSCTAAIQKSFSLHACSSSVTVVGPSDLPHSAAIRNSLPLHVCSSFDASWHKAFEVHATEATNSRLAMPPLESGETFEDAYDVILILDDRENFGGSRLRKVADSIISQFKILVEVRRLPVGDGIWIAQHKQHKKEYVLDFIVERKNVADLCSSIKDNRYRDQKLRLQRCGLKKLIYLVEGDPNSLEASESVKTACFTTEILEGFDVQRTTGMKDTIRKYGYLTKAISHYYSNYFSSDRTISGIVCPSYHEFVRKCQDLGKLTVSEVFAVQLMQVPKVTEEVALAVLDLYPTLLSLVRAYSELGGDRPAQEEMLTNQSAAINRSASKNIFNLVWGS